MSDAGPPAEMIGQVQAAVETAVGAAWDFYVRSAGKGLLWADIDGCASAADYRRKLAADPEGLVGACQTLLEYDQGLTNQEREALRSVVRIAGTLALRDDPAPQPSPAAAAPAATLAAALPAAAEPDAAPAVRPSKRLPIWPIVLGVLSAVAGLTLLFLPEAGTPTADAPAPAVTPRLPPAAAPGTAVAPADAAARPAATVPAAAPPAAVPAILPVRTNPVPPPVASPAAKVAPVRTAPPALPPPPAANTAPGSGASPNATAIAAPVAGPEFAPAGQGQ